MHTMKHRLSSRARRIARSGANTLATGQRRESMGFVFPPQGGERFSKFVKSEINLWTRVIKTADIKAK